VSQVVAGGPADQLGIKAGDVILAVDDHYLYTIQELNNAIARCKPGTEIKIRYRRYKMTYEAPLIVGSREANAAQR
jgi:S1-C subfamily serine protease